MLYWMQQSQRATFNHALEHAVEYANALEMGLIVGFALMKDYPEATQRAYAFMLEGLEETAATLHDRGIKFVLQLGEPVKVIKKLAQEAALVVTDRGYLRHQKQWRKELAQQLDIPVIQVETDAIVPVEVASDKREYAARTIRPKLMEQYQDFLAPLRASQPSISSLSYGVKGEDHQNLLGLLDQLSIEEEVPKAEPFKGGTQAAQQRFRSFLDNKLSEYDDHRNQPQTNKVSHMGMYLHFGQISPVWLAQQIEKKYSTEDTESYLEELLVRRELAINFVHYTDNYDSFDCLPDWALETLQEHDEDKRPHSYTRAELEEGNTHDPLWNAAMQQMKQLGYLHNYMRMYWGKKILEWSSSSSYAYKTALYLNNKYFLDGRDCNSYANVAWIFGLHDRAWQEREVFGKVRIMTLEGLKKKFDWEAYLEVVKKHLDSC